MKRITVSLEDAAYAQFRVACAEIQLSMSLTAAGLIIEWLKEGGESDEQKTARAVAAAERVAG